MWNLRKLAAEGNIKEFRNILRNQYPQYLEYIQNEYKQAETCSLQPALYSLRYIRLTYPIQIQFDGHGNPLLYTQYNPHQVYIDSSGKFVYSVFQKNHNYSRDSYDSDSQIFNYNQILANIAASNGHISLVDFFLKSHKANYQEVYRYSLDAMETRVMKHINDHYFTETERSFYQRDIEQINSIKNNLDFSDYTLIDHCDLEEETMSNTP